MTLDVARIIPWRWNLKKHEIACEIQRVAKHDGFEKGMPSRQDLKVMHEDVYFSMIHPEDLERVVDTHHQAHGWHHPDSKSGISASIWQGWRGDGGVDRGERDGDGI